MEITLCYLTVDRTVGRQAAALALLNDDTYSHEIATRDQSAPVARLSIRRRIADGRRLRILYLVEDFCRECLATVVGTSLNGVRREGRVGWLA